MNSEVSDCCVVRGGSRMQGPSLKMTYIMLQFRGRTEVGKHANCSDWYLPASAGMMVGSAHIGVFFSACFELEICIIQAI